MFASIVDLKAVDKKRVFLKAIFMANILSGSHELMFFELNQSTTIMFNVVLFGPVSHPNNYFFIC